jgi:phage/plasmid-associated DNA primase
MTKITQGSYIPGLRHPDWDQALQAIREDAREWLQTRVGQAITGHPTPDGRVLVLQGGGENGKSTLSTDGFVVALGDYASIASAKFLTSGEHSTERADLRGQRVFVAEETSEGRCLDVTAIKQIQDVGLIKARLLYRDNMTFAASHSLFITTNYELIVSETDHGTWRRLCKLAFPWLWRKPGEESTGPWDRPGNAGLKERLKAGLDGRGRCQTLVRGRRR